MKSLKARILLAGILTLTLGATLASAQQIINPPMQDGPANGAVTGESLQAMLKNLGHNLKVIKLNNGAELYQFPISNTNGNFTILMEISPDKSKVWMSAWFKQLPQGYQLSNDQMVKMLEANERIGPAHFRYSSQARMLSLSMALDNRALTADNLARGLDLFTVILRDTYPIWGFTNEVN